MTKRARTPAVAILSHLSGGDIVGNIETYGLTGDLPNRELAIGAIQEELRIHDEIIDVEVTYSVPKKGMKP